MIPEEVMTEYNLWDKIHNGCVYARVNKGMYGLPQAGRLANDDLVKHLEPHGFHPVPHTPGLWMDDKSDLQFTLVVDDFLVKYTNRKDADRLISALTHNKRYKISTDWEAKWYVGLDLNWNYTKGYVDISMPGYIERALQRFAHPKPKRATHTPRKFQGPEYGARIQYEPGTPFQYPIGISSFLFSALGSQSSDSKTKNEEHVAPPTTTTSIYKEGKRLKPNEATPNIDSDPRLVAESAVVSRL